MIFYCTITILPCISILFVFSPKEIPCTSCTTWRINILWFWFTWNLNWFIERCIYIKKSLISKVYIYTLKFVQNVYIILCTLFQTWNYDYGKDRDNKFSPTKQNWILWHCKRDWHLQHFTDVFIQWNTEVLYSLHQKHPDAYYNCMAA